ncbi:hypothetical protein L2E82_08312 [Cichorium intybus]|uniref:Uncharacterized protein n=1 Tax=Cichorium intybus TaxID=13427 RepID=A0ACB9G785_CICIN|nr:hypothetical protein L2E82_08312 [Cichorium intybus]
MYENKSKKRKCKKYQHYGLRKKQEKEEILFPLLSWIANKPPSTIVALLRRTSIFGGSGDNLCCASAYTTLPEAATSFYLPK